MWSTGGENGRPLQYSYHENPINSMKRQKDSTSEDDRKTHRLRKQTYRPGWRMGYEIVREFGMDTYTLLYLKWITGEVVLRWWRNRMGRPLSSPQIHQKNIWSWANSTKQLLKAGRGHQAPSKAAHCLGKEVGQKIKDKERNKRVTDGDPSLEGSLNRWEVSKHQETLSPAGLGEFFESQRAT